MTAIETTAGCVFADMGGGSMQKVFGQQGSASMKNTAFEHNSLFYNKDLPGSVLQARGPYEQGSLVRMEAVDFRRNTDDQPLLQQVVETVHGSSVSQEPVSLL